MIFLGRTRELGILRSALDVRESSVIEVVGPPGIGKSALVRRATQGFRVLHHRAPPLPDPVQRAAFLDSVYRGFLEEEARQGGNRAASWETALDTLTDALPRDQRSSVLVIDDAHRLGEARARFEAPLARTLSHVAGFHVVLVSPSPCVDASSPLAPNVARRVDVRPLSFRAVVELLPGRDARERLMAYSVFGGNPGNLRHLDRSAGLLTNVRRVILDGEAPLAEAGIALLERSVQTPSRYAAVLRALAQGEGDWGRIHSGVPDLSASGQVAPYLRKLDNLGIIDVRRSLDARPRTRARRYGVRDPFHAFWFRVALPRLYAALDGADTEAGLNAAMQTHAASVFPTVCRQFMASDALERLGHNARECGSLWGDGVEIEVAGILTSGAAFYGHTLWGLDGATSALARLDAEVRTTRYGFGRETRLRLIFTSGQAPPSLERDVARRYDAELITAGDLAGGD